jgi:hypothetical protein
MATQFGRKLGAVHAIAQIPFAAIRNQFGFSGVEFASASEVVLTGARKSLEIFLAPATIRISDNVNVIFELR